MGNWNYVRTERTRVTNGDYRLEVVSAENTKTQEGFDMVLLWVRPNGSELKIQYKMSQKNMKYFMQQLTEFYDSFNVEEGNEDVITWVGAIGAGRLKENERGYMEVAYFLDKKRAEKLPPWVGDMPERQTVTDIGGDVLEGAEELDDGSAPF